MSHLRELRPIVTGNDEAGQGLAEYALILALIAITAVAALMFMGSSMQGTLSMIGAAVDSVL
jgi:Flp pilus assembly pilin Flp